jgi:hypothetical protein
MYEAGMKHQTGNMRRQTVVVEGMVSCMSSNWTIVCIHDRQQYPFRCGVRNIYIYIYIYIEGKGSTIETIRITLF